MRNFSIQIEINSLSTSSKYWQATQGYRKLLFLEQVDGQNSKNNYLDNKVPTSI